MQSPLFCEVIIPLSVKGTFTYLVPEGWEELIVPGIRVEVQFGRRKHYTGIVKNLHYIQPTQYKAKALISIVDDMPVVTEIQLKFWEWIAGYYCCEEGEVMRAALPTFFRPDSETIYIRHPYSTVDILELPDDEYLIASALTQQDALKLADIQAILQKKSVQKTVTSLIDKGVLVLKEYMEEKYKPKTEIYTRLHPKYGRNQDRIKELFGLLARSPKQTDLLLAYLSEHTHSEWTVRKTLIKKSEVSGSVHRTMVEKEIFENEERIVSRTEEEDIHDNPPPLSKSQQAVYSQINTIWNEKRVILLRGVTASGKTHIYAELIRDTLAKGQQVLYLVPEIALTTQLIRRLKSMLGTIGVYHSKFNPAERTETWLKVLKQEYNIVVGARSAMFLPFQNLGLIIVDEEHDGSYKQYEPAPRYQSRDSIIYLAHQIEAKVLLGSATPSIESWTNAQAGRYGYVELTQRHGEMNLPELHFINMTEARKNKKVTGMLSEVLQSQIHKTLKKGKQVIVFQNRRGYAPYITCKDCAWIPECPHCDVNLTFHKYSEQLKCHYCGYTSLMPKSCPSCQSTLLEMRGAGTERVEDDLQALFPDAKLLRMDYDTAKSKTAYERIIDTFEQQEADILIGTQMVTKGLDFKNVELVGVLSADSLLYYPDFRATERAFQLLSQVSGRAGRSDELGKVFIQISNLQHPIVTFLKKQDIVPYYKRETAERNRFKYPPFTRIIHISVQDQKEQIAQQAALFLFQQLQPQIAGECLGPSIPSKGKLKGKYIREILIKLDRDANKISTAKRTIEQSRLLMYQYDLFKKVRLIINVDP